MKWWNESYLIISSNFDCRSLGISVRKISGKIPHFRVRQTKLAEVELSAPNNIIHTLESEEHSISTEYEALVIWKPIRAVPVSNFNFEDATGALAEVIASHTFRHITPRPVVGHWKSVNFQFYFSHYSLMWELLENYDFRKVWCYHVSQVTQRDRIPKEGCFLGN